MEYSIIGALFISGNILVGIGIYVLLEGRRGRNLWFSGFALSAAIHSFAYAFELTSTTVEMAFMFTKIEYLGIAFQSFFAIMTTAELTGNVRKLDKRIKWGMLIFSSATVLAVYTNNLHHLYYAKDLVLDRVGVLTSVRVTPGIWYRVFVIYVNLTIAAGAVMMARAIKNAPSDLKPQFRIFLLGFLAPCAGSIIYLFGLSPFGLDPTPYCLMITSVIFAYGLNHHQLFHVVPIAQGRVIDSMNDVVVIVNKNNRVMDHNPSLNRLLGCQTGDHLGKHLYTVFCDYPEVAEFAMHHADEQTNISLAGDVDRVYRVSVHTIQGRRRHVKAKYLMMTEITNEMSMLRSMKELASLDSLTNIANRRSFFAQAKDLNSRCEPGLPVSVIMIDIDAFKAVNDQHGHEAGDVVLQGIADLLKQNTRSQDILARYGGEEFVMVAPGIGAEAAVALAERLRKVIVNARLTYENHRIGVTASLGVASGTMKPDFEIKRLIRCSDMALYEAKNSGKNRVVLYQDDHGDDEE